jgi:hypothetical protein
MSLKLNFDICQSTSCKWFSFKETTGLYNETTNPGGWGAPNPEISEGEDASVSVLLPGSTTPVSVDLSNFLPSDDTDYSLDITNTDLGLTNTSALPGGIYQITYNVVVETSTYSKTKYVVFTCEYDCKIEQLLSDLVLSECCLECDNEEFDKVIYLKTLLCIAKSAADCGNLKRAQEAIDTLDDLIGGLKKCKC